MTACNFRSAYVEAEQLERSFQDTKGIVRLRSALIDGATDLLISLQLFTM